ncbi:MAG: thiamine pyrophosphate-dependent enzyme [Thermoplasmata archaeon]
MEIEEFFRMDRWPNSYCPGCGNGIVMNCMHRALQDMVNLDRLVMVGGIGCSARIDGYVFSDAIHTTHGRAIAFATGIKLGNPELDVIVIGGDGDIGAIGGNHLINAARRNMDLLVICVNNWIYGMTGGQISPASPHECMSTTTPFGNPEYPFEFVKLVAECGANYAARWSITNPFQLVNCLKTAFQKKGFRFVEVLSICPTGFGRNNRINEPAELYKFLKEKTYIMKDENRIAVNLDGKFPLGEFANRDRESYIESLKKRRG